MDLDYWYSFFPLRYRSKTMHLTCLQDGAFRRLIDEYMISRHPLPDNDHALARITGLSFPEWMEMAEVVRHFFVQEGGKLYQVTCNEELTKQDGLSRKRSISAQNAAKARWLKTKDNDAPRMPDASAAHAPRMPAAMRSDAKGQDSDRTEEGRTSLPQTPSVEIKNPDLDLPIVKTAKINGKANGHDEATRGSRLTSTWEPSDEDREFAVGLGLRPDAIGAEFRDYWIARAGAGGVKRDWAATWRTWCRKSAGAGQGRSAQPSVGKRTSVLAIGRELLLEDELGRDNDLASFGAREWPRRSGGGS